jgi:hypothetical protein
MHKNITQFSLISTISALAIALSSCGAGKVTECKNMLAVASKAATANKSFTTKGEALSKAGQFKDPTKSAPLFTTLGTDMGTVGKEMKALEIKDEQLKGLQARFVELYEGMSKGSENAATDLTKKDQAAFVKHWTEFGNVVAKEEPLVNEINTYCGATKPQ